MISAPPPADLSPDLLGLVRRINVTARRLVSEMFAGRYHSAFKGRGLEFSEVREYEPGDDVRDIDWNVTARRGHPYVKRYVEERELTTLFLVDVSGSQEWGSRGRPKTRLAAEFAAVLALAALKNGDKTGLMLFTDRIEHHLRPRKTRGHVLRIVRDLLTFRPQGRGTNLAAALEELNRVQRKRAVVFLISDFLDAGFERPFRLAARRHDLVAVGIRDPWENGFAPGVRLLLEDAETGAPAAWRTGRGPVNRWEDQERSFAAAGADTLILETNRPLADPILAFFQRRGQRHGR